MLPYIFRLFVAYTALLGLALFVAPAAHAAETPNAASVTAVSGQLETLHGSASGIKYWAWMEPNDSIHDNVTDPKFSVGAQSRTGIKRIELYVDGKLAKKCETKGVKTNVVCDTELSGKNYGYGNKVTATAIVVDMRNRTAMVPGLAISFFDATVRIHDVLDAVEIAHDQTANYTATALAPKGLIKIDVYANGEIERTCDFAGQTATQTCALTIAAADYPAGGELAINSHAVGASGLDAWTEIKKLAVQPDPDRNKPVETRLSGWLWAEPMGTASENTLVHAQALALDGLAKMEIMANGKTMRTCAFNGQKSAQDCDVTAANHSVLTVLATDTAGKTAVSDVLALDKKTDESHKYTLSAWLNVWPENTDMQSAETRTVTAGGDGTNGIKRVEIMVNGTNQLVCDYYDRTSSRACSLDLKGDGPLAALGFMGVNARITDTAGNVAWSEIKVINVTDVRMRDKNELSTVLDMQPADEVILPLQAKELTATAHAASGIGKIDLFVNGNRVQTCNANGSIDQNRTCGLSISGSTYAPGAWIAVLARVTDVQGYTAWSEAQTFKIRVSGDDPVMDMQTSITTQPNAQSDGKFADITLTAEAPQGIERILMQADGQPIQACFYGRSQGRIDCRATLDLNGENIGDLIEISSQITDVFGNVKQVEQTFVVKQPTSTDLVKQYLVAYVTGS